ncbi:MAG: recombinase family protein [Afipia sp.]|nr:recombinase family protein [Afipia sp.]
MPLTEGKAAQYVRMSTDMQKYSIENQASAIAIYAAKRGLTIVRSYEDAGKSGLKIGNRAGLKRLLEDVKSGNTDFATVLVYDVSRWGRFQNSDESAYYEFLCQEAGVRIEYCAEQFRNDGSLTSTVIKNIKRAMAGEFSRELSVKVFAGQSRIVTKGFRMGSTPGFGLRRVLVDENKVRKGELKFGERKSIQGDHTILVLGDSEEVRIVRWVYDQFVDQDQSLNQIARMLNRAGIRSASGHPWYWASVRQLLSNEKYMGNSVYNRTSKKLDSKYRRNPSNEWVRGIGAFEAIVSPARFRDAQWKLGENVRRYSDSFLLDVLSSMWCRDGYLNIDAIEASSIAPSTNCYKAHFGSISQAYRKIGYVGRRKNRYPNIMVRNEMRRRIVDGVLERGGSARIIPSSRQIRINEELTAAVGVGRAKSSSPIGSNEWQFGYRSQRKPDFLILARMDRAADKVRDYFVLPYIYLPHGAWLTISGKNYKRLEAFRIETLQPFFEFCGRAQVEAAP